MCWCVGPVLPTLAALPACCSLPLSHIILRLEAISAGLWPEPSEGVRPVPGGALPAHGADPSSRRQCVWCCGGGVRAAAGPQGALLDGGVAGAGVVFGGSGDGAARAALRLGLLKSLVAHCRIALEQELSSSLTGQVGGRNTRLMRQRHDC